MKVYVSVDIEGVAGIAAPEEVDMAQGAQYEPFRRQMTAEANAACRGACAAGATQVIVKDAHWTGRNIDPHGLQAPEGCDLRLIRGWSGHPFAMVQDLDASFDAVAFVGYHAAAGGGGNPLAHTISGRRFARIELNGRTASEYHLYGLAAGSVGVPIVFLSGDATVCAEARTDSSSVVTVAVQDGHGASTTSVTTTEACRLIESGVREALSRPLPAPLDPPERTQLRVTFRSAVDAYAKSFYPGAQRESDMVLCFETRDYLAALTFLWFAAQ